MHLSDRSQYVVINNQPSGLLSVLSGVLQDSILGPLLFLIYINDTLLINIHSSLLILLQMTPSALDLLPTMYTDEQLLRRHKLVV